VKRGNVRSKGACSSTILNVQHPLAARRQAKPTGVIETLSAGYAAVNRHLWVLLLPILVDVILWVGPHVSYSPLVDPTVTRASEWARQVTAGQRRGPSTPPLAGFIEDVPQWLIARTGEVNGLSLVARGPIPLPTLTALPGARGELWFVSDWRSGVALLSGCLVASLVLGGWFYRSLAAASAGASASGRYTPRDIWRVLGLIGALTGAGVLLGLPMLLLIGFVAVIAWDLAGLGILLMLSGVAFALLHLFFVIDAIVISNVGPLHAIQHSVGVVRRHLVPSAALVLLTVLIVLGMGRVWEIVASSLQSPYGIGLSILGNAYIVSGLIAAGMIFYTERAEALTNPGPATALSPS
jgi:hypothetical protein